MLNNDFNKSQDKIHKIVKRMFIVILTLIVLIVAGKIYVGYYIYDEIQENGGVKNSLVEIMRLYKQIDKESDK